MRYALFFLSLFMMSCALGKAGDVKQPAWLDECKNVFDCEFIVTTEGAKVFSEPVPGSETGHTLRKLDRKIGNPGLLYQRNGEWVQVYESQLWWNPKLPQELNYPPSIWWVRAANVVGVKNFTVVEKCWPFKTLQADSVSEWVEYAFARDGSGVATHFVEFEGEVEKYPVQAYTYTNIFLLRAMPSDGRRIPSSVWQFSENTRESIQAPSSVKVTRFEKTEACN